MIEQQLLWKPNIQEHGKQPDVPTSEEYWKVDNTEDPARPQSNTGRSVSRFLYSGAHTEMSAYT